MSLSGEPNDAKGEADQTSPDRVEGIRDDAERAVVTREYDFQRDSSGPRSASDSQLRHDHRHPHS